MFIRKRLGKTSLSPSKNWSLSQLSRSDQEYIHFPRIGCWWSFPSFPPPPPLPTTFRHVLLTVHLYQPIYLPGWTEALWEYIALSKNRPDKISNPDLSTRSQPHSLVDHYYFEKKQMKITLTDFCRSLKPFFFWTNCPYKWGGKKASFNTSLLQRDNVNFLWWQRPISLSSPYCLQVINRN